MDSPITATLKTPAKATLLREVWRLSHSDAQTQLTSLTFYFQCYQNVCRESHRFLEAYTHQDVATIAKAIICSPRSRCEEVIEDLFGTFKQDRRFEIEEGLKLVGRAVFCLDLAEWLPSETFAAFLKRCLASHSAQDDSYRLQRSFNARNIAKVARSNVQWTNILNKHLEIAANDNDVAIFQRCSILDLYERSSLASSFPPGFLQETRKTFASLLPEADGRARQWFGKEERRFDLDPALRCRPHLRAADRRINSPDFWRDRIIVLKEVYEECKPKGFLQFLRDDRRPIQYWTFWVAIFAFLLSLIACIEGALQVYKAYNPAIS